MHQALIPQHTCEVRPIHFKVNCRDFLQGASCVLHRNALLAALFILLVAEKIVGLQDAVTGKSGGWYSFVDLNMTDN